ncbi:uncharacterized protein ARMOST_15260 [Armillaria ostoyae]|uniref:F-box domain-containing protein n=1 Tax=Armillaria ostoyae TaxID=47428 RepID=A0A284RSY2_ARMOS|nr:uncharacterized protein ARMOST_15260 [Armillaria ostoyae]
MSYSQSCIRCRFKAVKPHIPAFDAEALLRSGTGVLSPEISSGLRTDISSLERELSVIDELFHEISSRRESVRKALNCHEAAFAPIRTLPLDILLEIFAKVPTNALRRDYAPWVIGQVCSLWRTISLSTPSLWSNICFDIYHAATGDQKLQALTTILSRSGDHPLTISIDSPSDGFHFPHNFASAGDLRILAVHGSRWTSLELNMNRTDLHNAFDIIDRSNRPLTHLRRLHISTTEGSASLNMPIFSPSPILYCILQGVSIMTLPVPLSNLATLTSELEHLSELPYLLRMATELEVLRIIPLTNSMPTYEYDGPMVTNTSLRRLSIQCIPWAQRYTLPRAPLNFSGISLPGLLELDLETGVMHDTGGEPFTPEDILQLCHMLEQSRCRLKILRVDSPIHFSAISPLLVSHGQSLTAVHLFVDEDNVFGLIRGLNA